MSIFSKLKNFFKPKKKQHNNQSTNKKEQTIKDRKDEVEEQPYEIKYTTMPNGNLQIDFYDKESHFTKFYDTTRLIIARQPLNIEGEPVHNCAVSWYGQNDLYQLNKKTGVFDSVRAQAYRGVLAQIDITQLQKNPTYCSLVMKSLLDQVRVEKYLERGMQENPKEGYPCGKYVGGIEITGKGYRKFFDVKVGQASHYSDLMIHRREERREMIKAKKQKDIENKKQEIKRLQEELREMEM